MILVDSVNFTDDGLIISYIDDEEIRVGGKVRVAHQVQLHASHPDYRADGKRLHELAVEVVANALEDFNNTPSHVDEVDTGEEEKGMGY